MERFAEINTEPQDDPELDSFINKDSFSMMADINDDDIAAG